MKNGPPIPLRGGKSSADDVKMGTLCFKWLVGPCREQLVLLVERLAAPVYQGAVASAKENI